MQFQGPLLSLTLVGQNVSQFMTDSKGSLSEKLEIISWCYYIIFTVLLEINEVFFKYIIFE